MTPSIREHLTRREQSLGLIVAALALTVGIWIGVWLVPTAALDVPTNTYYENGEIVRQLAYQPVPTYLPVASVLLVGITAYGSLAIYSSADTPELPVDFDGGERDE